jgi:hypothetical protein
MHRIVRVVVQDLDIGDKRHARKQTLEQVVAQQGVLRNAIAERRLECFNVIEAFTRINSFSEQILINVRNGGGVRIDARTSRERKSEPGLRCARRSIELSAIKRMQNCPDEPPGGVTRELSIGVKRDHVPHSLKERTLGRYRDKTASVTLS